MLEGVSSKKFWSCKVDNEDEEEGTDMSVAEVGPSLWKDNDKMGVS